MPYDDHSADDPMVLVGTEVAADSQTDLEMAYTFAEEFARLGFDEKRLLRIFTSPSYAGAHRLLQALGEEPIRDVIREVLNTWGRFRPTVHDAPVAAGAAPVKLRLPVEGRQIEGACDESSL
jgi:hypothetical protein